jgi:hypothetical protein
MHRDWQAVAALSLAGVALCGERAPAAEPAVSLRILWVETGLGDRFVRNVGLLEARAVLEPVGVGIVWRSGPPATESPEDEIRVVPLARRLGEKDGRRILAATANGIGPRTVWLDWAGMLWLASVDGNTLASAPPLEKRRLGLALGRVLAHELIHALLPNLLHASHGLMDEAMREPLLAPATLDARSREALNDLVARARSAPQPAARAEGTGVAASGAGP